jgi:hypothetical protein
VDMFEFRSPHPINQALPYITMPQLILHLTPLNTKQVCRGTRLPAGTLEPQQVTAHPQCIVVAPHHQERVNERGDRVSCLSKNSNVTAGTPGGFRTSRTPMRGTGRGTARRGMPPGRGQTRGRIPTRRAPTTEPTTEIGLTGGRRGRRPCKSRSGSMWSAQGLSLGWGTRWARAIWRGGGGGQGE